MTLGSYILLFFCCSLLICVVESSCFYVHSLTEEKTHNSHTTVDQSMSTNQLISLIKQVDLHPELWGSGCLTRTPAALGNPLCNYPAAQQSGHFCVWAFEQGDTRASDGGHQGATDSGSSQQKNAIPKSIICFVVVVVLNFHEVKWDCFKLQPWDY